LSVSDHASVNDNIVKTQEQPELPKTVGLIDPSIEITKNQTRKTPRFLRQSELVEKVAAYDPTVDEETLNRAYVYAMRMHGAQTRASGDPYFAHPIEVAGILTDYRLDQDSIVAALLHDTIEDTNATEQEIEENFGRDVAELVQGVTKLTKLELKSEYTKQSENLRKFILAISKDIRVLLIKLADRLHNMRTLHFVKPEKRERIARETLEVYAPLARQIGCNRFAVELEDLSFSHIHPKANAAILQRLQDLRDDKGDLVKAIAKDMANRLHKAGVEAKIMGREKSPYSIWKKLQTKKLGFSKLSDIYAFRVVTSNIMDCYKVLYVLHQTWTCTHERFKDYISTPKANNYQSLHTTMVGHKGTNIEVQIRTQFMDNVAENGLAAHWSYKNESYGFDEHAATEIAGRNPLNAIRTLTSIAEYGGDSDDWVEHAKMEMFSDQVFVFTPKGRLISLPKGAMPLDFAYGLHTSLGETAVGCMINGEHRPLRTELRNGDQVEILTDLEPRVSADWFSLTITGKARASIRRQLRQTQKEDFIKLGKLSLERTAQQVSKTIKMVNFQPVLERFNVPSEDQLYEWIGRKKILPYQVIEILFPGTKLVTQLPLSTLPKIDDGEAGRAYIKGSHPSLQKPETRAVFERCCFPVPGERIVGIVDDEVVHVHAIDCLKLATLDEGVHEWIDIQWTLSAEKHAISVTRIRLIMKNVPGVLGEACTLIGEAKGNIVNIRIEHSDMNFLQVDFDIEVFDAKHINSISGALRACKSIDRVERYRARS